MFTENRRTAREEARHKRELMLGQIELQKQFNEDDEARDFAAEEVRSYCIQIMYTDSKVFSGSRSTSVHEESQLNEHYYHPLIWFNLILNLTKYFQGLEPDGYAEHHEQINETTAFDMSNSEFWSSFSSSEEALLECAGLILNLPLTPHPSCRPGVSESQSHTAARANALTYRLVREESFLQRPISNEG